jgi:dTDP-4-dehydrorhamnose reductase
MKWLIVGGGGQLGHAMQVELANTGIEYLALNRSQLDISNEYEVVRVLKEVRPGVVLNAAAWTDVDEAERDEAAARRVNAHGPSFLAKACIIVDAKLVHVSTDYVFSGRSHTPWSEAEVLEPVSAYGRTKAEGEMLVQSLYPQGAFIVRTAWLYSPWGKNFVRTMVRLALRETKMVEVVNDQLGQPTSAIDLAQQIRKMMYTSAVPGIYHGTNDGQATWFEFAREILLLCGANPDRVNPVESSHYVRPAKRPGYSVLGHDRWIQTGIQPMRDWHEALKETIPAVISSVGMEE